MTTLTLPEYPIPAAQVTPEPAPAQSSVLPIIPRRVVNSVADSTSDRQLSVAGAGAFVPFGYGAFRTGPLVAQAANHNGRLVLLLVWCLGEIEAIDGLYLSDGSAVPVTVATTHYTGSATQGVDPTLAAAIDGWDNDLVTVVRGQVVGLAYSVVSIPSYAQIGVPAFVADIRGRRVYDPRDGGQSAADSSTWLYSENPALALADLEVSTLYGRGRSIDWASVATVADDCDELVQGIERRRALGLVINSQSSVDGWVNTLMAYAGCFVVPVGNFSKLVSNRPASVSRALSDEDIVADDNGRPNLSIKLRGLSNAPTVVRVIYTETTTREHRDEPAIAYLSGVLDGSVEWRESVVRLPGINRYSQAYREAVERLNSLNLTDLDVRFVTHDEGLQDLVGDIIMLTSWRGLTNKPLRITDCIPVAPGRWQISATEYQSNVYSDGVETAPVFSDTDLLSPLEPPIPLGLAVAEEVYQVENGTYLSRLAITWVAADYAYLDHYDVRVTNGPSLVYSVSVPDPECTTPAVQDNVFYTVTVRTVSTVGAASDWAVVNITADGKYLIPSDVPSLAGFEVGGEVRLNWEPAIDVDIWRYEIRYGAPGVDWDNAILLDRVDALRLVSRDVPQGTWDFLVKAIDSVNQYSLEPARRQLEVTLDSGAYLVDSYEFNAPTLTNVREFALGRVDGIRRFVTEMGDAVASMWPNAMATYSNPLVTYHSSGASEFLTETWDAGTQISGTWRADVDATAVSGSITVAMELSVDGIQWDSYANLTAKVTARYARIRIQAANSDTMLVNLPGVSVRVDAVPREENGTDTSTATLPTTITLANEYSAVQSISVIPVGSAALSPTVDNIVVGNPTTFDVYIFDNNGAQVVNEFIWSFGGV